jgi:TRAP-type C4-dicarboxylate transport system permease small subunit
MNKFFELLTRFEKICAAFFVVVLTALVITDVGAREIFKTGLPWAQKAAVNLMIWAGFLGACLMTQKGDHLRPEVGDKLWKGKLAPIAERVRNALVALFCLALAYNGFLYVEESREFAELHVVLGVPLWILQLVIPWTFFSMGLRYAWFTYRPLLKTERSLH